MLHFPFSSVSFSKLSLLPFIYCHYTRRAQHTNTKYLVPTSAICSIMTFMYMQHNQVFISLSARYFISQTNSSKGKNSKGNPQDPNSKKDKEQQGIYLKKPQTDPKSKRSTPSDYTKNHQPAQKTKAIERERERDKGNKIRCQKLMFPYDP